MTNEHFIKSSFDFSDMILSENDKMNRHPVYIFTARQHRTSAIHTLYRHSIIFTARQHRTSAIHTLDRHSIILIYSSPNALQSHPTLPPCTLVTNKVNNEIKMKLN